MVGCAKYESLLSEIVSLGSDLTVARDQLAITSKKDSRAYQLAHSRFKEAERKWKHARRELKAHKAELASHSVLNDQAQDQESTGPWSCAL